MTRVALRCEAAAVAGLLSIMLTGCMHIGSHIPLDASAGLYERASLEYRLDAGRLNVPVSVARIEGQTVSYDQIPSRPVSDTAVGALTVKYPHPDLGATMAMARLEVFAEEHSQGSTLQKVGVAPPARVHETWELAIRKSELDNMLGELAAQGYFDRSKSVPTGVEMATRVDSHSMTKRWHQSPTLESLMLRVRGQGTLVAYERPNRVGLARNHGVPSSVIAYRELLRRESQANMAAAVQTPRMAATPAQTGGQPPQQMVPPNVAPPPMQQQPFQPQPWPPVAPNQGYAPAMPPSMVQPNAPAMVPAAPQPAYPVATPPPTSSHTRVL